MICKVCGEETPMGFGHICQHPTMVLPSLADVQRIEAKLDALTRALMAGGVGEWGKPIE